VSWLEALLLESVGQAIRGAAFAIPGSLGAQEGGYLLLAPLVGLPPDAALALSLAKRVRELVLGIPVDVSAFQRTQVPAPPRRALRQVLHRSRRPETLHVRTHASNHSCRGPRPATSATAGQAIPEMPAAL
jgi:hypothetical protein